MNDIKKDHLELSLLLLYKGILPSNPNLTFIDYSTTKNKLKNLGIKLSVEEIKFYFSFILSKVLSELINDPRLKHIDNLFANKIMYKNMDELYGQIKNNMDKKITKKELAEIVKAIIDQMSICNTNRIDLQSLLNTKTDWDNNRYLLIKSVLSKLLNREISKEEFHLFAEQWFYFFSLAQDMFNPDNYLKEVVKELKNLLKTQINTLKKNLSEEIKFCAQVKEQERFIKIDLPKYESLIKNYQEQILFLEIEKQQLNQNNGQNLNYDTLRKYAGFAAIFCVETLGFTFPKYNKDGNPILKLLQMLFNIDESHKDIDDIKNQLSQLHQKYQSFKKLPEIKKTINTLVVTANERSDYIDGLKLANIKFRELLLKLEVKPQLPINIDT